MVGDHRQIASIYENDLTWLAAPRLAGYFMGSPSPLFWATFKGAKGAVAAMGLRPGHPDRRRHIIRATGPLNLGYHRSAGLDWAGTLPVFTLSTITSGPINRQWKEVARQRNSLESEEDLTVMGGILTLTLPRHLRKRIWRR